MATRYYTEEAYEQIKQTIEQIDNVDVNPVVDFFGDLFQRIGQFLELYSVDDYKEDMQKWYNKVLDSHNTTISAVDSIFEAVNDVDTEYQKIMDEAVSSITNFRSTLNTLRNVISGKTSLADGKAAAGKFLAAGKNSLNGAYDTILTKMEARNFRDASLELIGDTLKLGAGFVGLLIPTTPDKYGVKCKKFVDTFTATLGDLGATATGLLVWGIFGVGSLFGMDQKDYLDFRFEQLTQSREYKEMNSVSDWLGWLAEDMGEALVECPEDSPYYPVTKALADTTSWIHTGYQGVDMVADAYDIISDIKDVRKTFDEWKYGKVITLEEYKEALADGGPLDFISSSKGKDGTIIRVTVPASEAIKKVISNWTGLPTSGWDGDPIKTMDNGFKVLGTLWSYGEKLLPNPVTGQSNISELPEVFFDKFKDTKFLKDVFDFARDYLVTEVS